MNSDSDISVAGSSSSIEPYQQCHMNHSNEEIEDT